MTRYRYLLIAVAVLLVCAQAAGAATYSKLASFGTFGVAASDFRNPYGLKTDGNGYIYIADTGNSTIKKFDRYGTFINSLGSMGQSNGQFMYPQGVALDKINGDIYVSDTGSHQIQKFHVDGSSYTYTRKFGTKGSGNGQLTLPRDIELDSSGKVYVCDSGNNRIVKFGPAGVFLANIGAGASLSNPYGLALDAVGNIYVADTFNHRIVKFSPSGALLMQFGTFGTAAGSFTYPRDVAVDSSGNIFVADTDNYRVQKFDANGNYLDSFGKYSEFLSPQQLAIEGSNVYVIDSNTNKLQIYDVTSYITNVYAEPNPFSPDANGFVDATTIHYTIQKPAKITITIYNANNNNLVRNLITDAQRITDKNSEVWDGKNNSGTFVGSGLYIFKINAIDASNYRPPQVAGAVSIEKTAPTTIAAPLAGAFNASQTVTLTCDDSSGSGCDKIYYTTDGTTPTISSTVYTDPISFSVTTTLKYFAADVAGNHEAVKTQTYTFDSTPPTGTVSINSGVALTNNTAVTLSLTCNDNIACSKMRFRNATSEAWSAAVNFAQTTSWTMSAEDGTKTVYAQFKDSANNWSTTYSDTIVLDTLPPVTTASPARGIYGSAISVTLTTNEASQIYYSVDGTTPSIVYTDPIPIAATTTLKFFAVDTLGHSETVHSGTYTIDPTKKWSALAAGEYYTLAVKLDGTLWAWGWNWIGQLGDGTTVEKYAPVRIGSDADWKDVAAGCAHTVALKDDGTLWAWGNNGNGQLGNGTIDEQHAPVRIGSDADWKDVAAGCDHTIALKDDGTLWAWGNNGNGQLGNGTIDEQRAPMRIGTAGDWKTVSAGDSHTIALKTDGTLWGWGFNYDGELGDGTRGEKHAPVQIGTAANWTAIDAGDSHTLALKSDGTLWAWGSNSHGQLGDGTTDEKHSPWKIGTDSNWTALAAGEYHTVALKMDGTLWAWGYNRFGQLGDVTSDDKYAPVRIYEDITPPAGTIIINDGAAVTNAFAVVLTLSCNDNIGCARMQFKNADDTWSAPEPFAESKEWTLSAGDGTKIIYVKFYDEANNWSAVRNTTILLDQTPPAGVAAPVGKAYKSAKTVTLACDDGTGSGCADIYYTTDGSTPTTSSIIYTGPISIPVSTTVKFFAKDIAGNAGTVNTEEYIIDMTAPVTTATPATGTYSVDKNVTLSCDDGTGSGCNKIYYTTDGSIPTASSSVYTGPISMTTPANTVAAVTLQYFSADLVGNQETVHSDIYTIDKVFPTGTIKVNDGADYTNNAAVALNLTCSDNIKCALMKFSNDNATWSTAQTYPATTPVTASWSLSTGDETKTVYVKYRDSAGNWSQAYSNTIVLDTVPPVTTASPAWGTYGSAVSVTLTANEASTIYYSVDRTTPTVIYTGPIAIAVTTTLKYFAVDIAGNSGAIRYRTYTIDPTAAKWSSLAVGDRNAVALKSDGTLWAWGDNYTGQLGDGTTVSKYSPKRIGTAANWTASAIAALHTVALKSDGTLWAWGSNDYGQLGDGTIVGKYSPRQIGTDTNWSAVAAGETHTVALKSDGTLWAWGDNIGGELGDGTTINQNSPVPIGTATNWTAIAAGDSHTLALKSGTLWAWGANYNGQLGDGTTVDRHWPKKIGEDADWTAIGAGFYYSVALKSNGTLWAWGVNDFGQLGDGTTIDKNAPVQIGTDTNWTAVAAGAMHTVALKSNGTLWAWGANDTGQLGDGTTVDRHLPKKIGTDADWTDVAAGYDSSAALKLEGTLWAWGANYTGQLGDGTTVDKYSPVRIYEDITAPTGTILINSGASVTNITAVTLTLSCTDNVACKQMQFKNENGTWSALESYSTSASWDLSAGDGTKEVSVQFRDAANNRSATVKATIELQALP